MADDEEVVEQEEEVVGTSESESNDNDEPTPIDRSQYDYAPPTVNTSRPWGKSSGLDSNFYAPIEKPGSRQLRVNGKGLTGTWTARKFPYIWVETGVPANAEILTTMGITATTAVPVCGSILPDIGEPWTSSQPYLKCQDLSFQETENGMCEATVNYTSDGYTGDLQIDCSVDEIVYKQPYRYKWEVDANSDNNPPVENIDSKETILLYNVSKKLDYITLARTNHTVYDIDDYQYYITQASICYGKINKSAWKGFGAETVLCTGLSFEPEFSITGQLLFVNVKANFKIRLSGMSWENMWKDPTTEKTSKGADLTWHQLPNQPFPEGSFYTTDPNKIGVKIFVGDVTLTPQVDGSITVTESQDKYRGGFYKPYVMGTDEEDNPVHVYYYWTVNSFDDLIFTPLVAPTTP